MTEALDNHIPTSYYVALLGLLAITGGIIVAMSGGFGTTRLDIDAWIRGEDITTASPPPPDPDLCKQALENLGDLKRIRGDYEAELRALQQAGQPFSERAQWLERSIRQLDNQIRETEQCFGSGPH